MPSIPGRIFPEQAGFTPGERKIAAFIENHADEVLFLTEQALADRIGTSIATVSRFWRSAGYDSGKDFRRKLRAASAHTPAVKLETTISRMDPDSLPLHTLEQSILHLRETAGRIAPGQLEEAAALLAGANLIYLHAPGPAAALGELLRYRLSRFGLTVRLMPASGHELLEPLAHVQAGDAVLLFNFTRLLPETEVILDYVKEKGCPAVMITDREEFRDGASVKVSFYVRRGERGEFHSMVAPLLLVEQIILSIGLSMKEQVLSRLENLGKLRAKYADRLPRGRA
ncbi:MurR/RpiR family transcriptional regulator [Paenibacillus spiritus]|uniref:MurR/RpiR family transcriptional regulator n=1 Tax=Paenibacillus spiritus TaxID=2496557 RepID=A0A5J5G6V7_9BACL|nr:MurR/RpiR family transcriptional regulator [Paenibacillus spiritus]KAA9002385.1 MurR/RpiR family transcriptional regulator [Paenibacillus spiritus]